MPEAADLRWALIRTDVRLSRFDPLPRILFFDDFDEGVNGWCELSGNHDGDLDQIAPQFRDLRPPQLSNCTFFDIGTHGSMDGTYALKLATRPQAGHTARALKRMTWAARGRVQFEMYFTYKAEQSFDGGERGARAWDGNYHPSEADFGAFTITNDVCEGVDRPRYHCVLRYVNTDDDGQLVQKWVYKTSLQVTDKMVRAGHTPGPDPHVSGPRDWAEVPDGHQPLCHNEVPTKINWHYLRWRFDTDARRNVELQVNDHVMDLREIPVPVYDHEYQSCDRLLNFCIDVRTHMPVRNFLFLDSVLVSVDW